jgi:hypothetical protein
MGDEDHSEKLPYRVRGAAQARPAPSASPALSDELRHRMQAAVSAERARATAQGQMDQDQPGRDQPGQDQERAEPDPPVIASAPADNGVAAPAAGQVGRAVRPEPVRPSDPAVKPEDMVRPVAPGSAARPRPGPGAPARGNHAAGLPSRPSAGPRQVSAGRHLIATSAIAVALAILAAGCLGVAVARYLSSSAAPTDTVSPAEQRAEAAAAAWITQQVSHAAVVACDPVMCAALTADGFPSQNVRVLGQTATYPLTSAVVVVTQAVRELFGSSFTSNFAPGVLAAFGSADASITVCVIASHGAKAYWGQLGRDRILAEQVGTDLVQTSGITVSAQARSQLVAGQVDARLLLAITSLVGSRQPVDILDFGYIGSGAVPAIPLRFAYLAESDQAAGTVSPRYLRALRASLRAVSTKFRPTSVVSVTLPGDQPALRVGFTAPTPLALFEPQDSS